MVLRATIRLAAAACASLATVGVVGLAEAKGISGGIRGGGVVVVGRGHGGGHFHGGRGPHGGGHWAHRGWHHGHWGEGRFGHRGRFGNGFGYGGLPFYGGYGGGYGPPTYPINALSVAQPTVGIPPAPVLPPAIYVIGETSGRAGLGRGVVRKGQARGGTVVVRRAR